jgi:hypothetical protein
VIRVQVRDPSMNITAMWETDDMDEAMTAASEITARRPDLIVEVLPVVGPER